MKNKFLLLIALTTFVFSPFSVNAMEIFVQPPEGENISIEVETGDTIEAIKAKIYDSNDNYPVDKQKLYYNGKWMEDGRTFGDYYSSLLGNTVKMELDSVVLDSVVNVILNANGGLFTDKEEYIIEDIYGDTPSNIVFPIREGYVFKGYYTQKDGGLRLEYYADNHVIENEMVFYAHWEVSGTSTIDFTKNINVDNFTNLEVNLIQILINNQLIDISDKSFKNSEGKILVKGDNEGNLTPAEGLTSIDNIIYTLSDTDKQYLLTNDESYIPDNVKVIFSREQEYKVIFDANGGIFNDNKNTIEIEDIINFNYNEFEKPTREGYSFVGFYTEKTGGKSFDEVMNSEAGIEEDTIFFARWEENSDGNAGTTESDEENPKTFDGIGTSIFMGTISLIGLIGATIYLRRKNKVRAN